MTSPNDNALAPIILFAYKRPEELEKTLAALRSNFLASQSDLYIFVDGPKHPTDIPKVKAVQQLIDQLNGFHSVNRFYSDKNCGLASSVIEGVSLVLRQYTKAIILEDDIITSVNFLSYMNQCLVKYSNLQQVFAVSGYSFTFNIPIDYPYDAYFFPRYSSWGWATWADRWDKVDWKVNGYEEFRHNKRRRQAFNRGGSDLARMLDHQMQGGSDSWAIRWAYAQFNHGGYTVFPIKSKVQNIGFSREATHTNIFNRYKTELDESGLSVHHLPEILKEDDKISSQFRLKYSIPTRIYNRLKTYIQRIFWSAR